MTLPWTMLAAPTGLAALLALSTAAGAGGASGTFRYGVAAGEVTASSALLWTRADEAGPVAVEVATDPAFGATVVRAEAVASPSRDLSLTIAIRGLRPATRYAYRFRQGAATSAPGSFVTAPPAGSRATVRFAVSGDADATAGPTGAPAFNRFQVYARMVAERNDFDVNLGDTIYSDSEVAGTPPALTLAAKRDKYREALSLPALRALRAATGLYSHWDDHEFANDFSRPEGGEALYAAGVQAFTEYAPVAYTAAGGLYRTFRWGRNVQLFFLDERSFRSAKASAGGACGSPPDVAPTLPAAVRARLANLSDRFRRPVPRACRERIDDPRRTLLGRAQLARFLRDLRASTATFKVVLNEVPLQQFYAWPYDRWEGYAAERRRVVEALRRVSGTVVLTTDTHANLAGDVRLRTLEPGGPRPTGVTEVVTGPVATNTFAKEVDRLLAVRGVASLLGLLFLEPAPPAGIGMRCVALDTYAYAEVVAARERLTVTLKDAAGRRVRDVTGAPCRPVVVPAP